MASVSMMLQWKAEGRAEGMAEGLAHGMVAARREDVLKVVRVRFPDAPHNVIEMLRAMKDLDQLDRWFDAALAAPSVERFLAMAREADHRADTHYC